MGRTAWPRSTALMFILTVLLAHGSARAQDEGQVDRPAKEAGSAQKDLDSAPNETAGELTPAEGFDIVKTKWGSLNISFYGLMRYLDQLPADQSFIDHLGRERNVKERNDINWHRTMIWLSGFALDKRLSYVFTVWSLPSTQQTLAFGNMQFQFSKSFILGAGIGPTLTARSMSGSHPFWASSDRLMAEEFFRGGFAPGAWIRGEMAPRLQYWLSVNTNLSTLGITAQNDARDFAYSGTVIWMPTTGEFGQRGGVADFEEHPEIATRFGISAAHAREDRASELSAPQPNETQIRLSDGVLAFETGAFADGVTMLKLNYDVLAVDFGLKLRGWTLQGEYFVRRLSDFLATGPLPIGHVLDHGFYVELMDMVIPKYLGIYAASSVVFDQFRRYPWEIVGGASAFPFAARSFRLNLHMIYIQQSPTGSSFGFYTAGQTGPTLSLNADLLF